MAEIADQNTAYTPGPWRVIDKTDILALEDTPQSVVIAATNFWSRPPTDTEKANARLIAAAPDYHKAAKERIARHDAQVQVSGGAECQDEFCNTFRPIVAKAEGREAQAHEHAWQALGFVAVHDGAALTTADHCACGAKRYAESSGHFGEPWPSAAEARRS